MLEQFTFLKLKDKIGIEEAEPARNSRKVTLTNLIRKM